MVVQVKALRLVHFSVGRRDCSEPVYLEVRVAPAELTRIRKLLIELYR